MPQHKGVEPWMRMWVMQIEVNEVQSGKIVATYLKVNFFVTEAGYLDFKTFLQHQSPTAARIFVLRTDYGRQKWWNDSVWIQTQLANSFINGNFLPNLLP